MGELIRIADRCYVSSDGDVISYNGDDYYRICGRMVRMKKNGQSTKCVKRLHHPGDVHEDYAGTTRRY